ncbi:hypothetical protein CY652_10640 [Burkholderia sp. WAC0059]|uniref:hypothetical protein n=1 Tax=Burkholderia sp. WAC0059 TaxID=2066022 RepID=UPI000C7F1555|nr:hypothetical protein [Burkholderia sp. WAC0059]PLZ02560.1 hypothetical protein CY652_10640 [Burkholderia sp. WAC0059]
MAVHLFDTDDVPEHGLIGAILLYNLRFWIFNNQANGKNFIDGRTWTFNSAQAYKKQFPYLSEDQIQRNLRKLIDSGVLLRRSNPDDGRDRTGWYALVDEARQLAAMPQASELHSAKSRDDYISTDVNTDIFSPARASRLPEDWALPRAWGEWALTETQQFASTLKNWAGGAWTPEHMRFEADKFRDYWHGKSGKDAAKTDWLATWRNWVRNAGPLRAAAAGKTGGAWRASDDAALAKANELGVGTAWPNESRDAWHARIQTAIDNGGSPSASLAPAVPAPVERPDDGPRKPMPDDMRQALRNALKPRDGSQSLEGAAACA